ncbi:GNAT family N-acetyltransferase [Kushneria aurantia]|uniref:GNAT family N-acetyltransferase n=1 Tax=Kushneria aurantia TaxID=504092 RepID=A0ABV6G1M3_9GAMM|nr:GNAT family N-acetyltransferase [Kushneria aurantia]
MTRLRFRRATPADVPALVALVTSAYRGEPSRSGWTTEADLLDGGRITPALVEDALAQANTRIVLAESAEPGDGELLACARIDVTEGVGEFGLFAVRPWQQGHGIGRTLLMEAEQTARDELGATRMTMCVIDARLELIGWYERRGYRRSGEYRPFPYGDERFGIPKRDDLRFAVLEKLLSEA